MKPEKLRLGYAGKDPLREAAERALSVEGDKAKERLKTLMKSSAKKGANPTEQMMKKWEESNFKKGGHANSCMSKTPKVHKMKKTQTDMVLPKLISKPKFMKTIKPEATPVSAKTKKYAAGGSVYEKQMLGKHPSKKVPHINYEAEMKGMRPVSKPSCAKDIPVKKMAIGGSGKIRHKEATKSGKPMLKKVNKEK